MQKVVPQFTEDEYVRLLSILDERRNFFDSYSAWLKVTQAYIEHLSSDGVTVFCPHIGVDELTEWCRQNRLKVNYDSCVAFAEHKTKTLIDAGNPRSVNYAPLLEDQLINHELIDTGSEDN